MDFKDPVSVGHGKRQGEVLIEELVSRFAAFELVLGDALAQSIVGIVENRNPDGGGFGAYHTTDDHQSFAILGVFLSQTVSP